MSRESVLVVSAWRNGISANTTSIVTQFEAKEKSGFRMLPEEEAILDLAQLLDGYDEFTEPYLLGPDEVLPADNGFAPEKPKAPWQPMLDEKVRTLAAIEAERNLHTAPQQPPPPRKKAKANASS